MQVGDDCRNEKLAIIAAWAPAGAASKTRTRRRDSHGRDGPQDQRRRYQSALQLGPGVAGARHHGGRLRGTGRLPPAAPLSAEPRQAGAGKIRARRAARLRRQQHPLHHLDQDRRAGARQALPLLARDRDRILWDFGSAAVHHKLYPPWLKPEDCKAGLIGLRGTVNPAFGLMERHAKEIASLLKEAGVHKMPVGVDIIEPPMMFELEKAGLKIKDGQQVMLEARELKNIDAIALLNRAAAMVDGAYHLINEELKPGVRENDIVAKVNEFLYRHGSDDVEAINAISGERCNPHPHNFTDRMLRPGDQAFFDILQSFMGY